MAVVNLTLITNGGKKTDQIPDTMTVREVYEKYNVNYDSCTNTVDSVPLQIGDLNKTLRELGCVDKVRMSSIVKADNAVEVTLAGAAVVVKSRYKLDQWQKALKYDPDLGLYDEETGESFFKVFIEDGPGSLNDNGAVFSGVAAEDGKAEITIVTDPCEEDKRTLIKDRLGYALINLKTLEDSLDEVIKDAEKYDQELDAMVKSI